MSVMVDVDVVEKELVVDCRLIDLRVRYVVEKVLGPQEEVQEFTVVVHG